MRENKFRAKNKNGEWLYGDLLRIGKDIFIVPYDGDWFDFTSFDNAFRFPPDEYAVTPETIGQYIGKKDKNGNEIYEGDIMQYNSLLRPEKYYRYVIAWNQMNMAFGLADVSQAHIVNPDISGGAQISESIIIGNIYDTPELLNLPRHGAVEVKINSIIQIEGVDYICLNAGDDDCSSCDFFIDGDCKSPSWLNCYSIHRKDGKDVIFSRKEVITHDNKTCNNRI